MYLMEVVSSKENPVPDEPVLKVWLKIISEKNTRFRNLIRN